LGTGLLVLVGVVLSLVWNRGWIGLSAFVGLGLTFAGLTDTCGMALLLTKIPWNKPRKQSPREMTRDHGHAVQGPLRAVMGGAKMRSWISKD
jgi:hypothetical protein